MKCKRIPAFLLIAIMLIMSVSAAEPPQITAKGAILTEAVSGEVLFEQNADERLFPASTTKLMTAIVALERGNLEDMVTVNASALKGLPEMGSSVYLIAGEQIKMSDLVKYILIASGNDACNVLAEHISGSVADFVTLMNVTADELGCTGTSFTNPHGLHDENHYTTARDLMKIAQRAMQNELIAQTVKETKVTLPVTNKHSKATVISSTNHLISKTRNTNYFYEGALGIKTGTTTPAGLCLVSGVTDGGLTLYSVVLGSQKGANGELGNFEDTIKLLDYGRQNFSVQLIAQANDPVCEIEVGLASGDGKLVLNPETSLSALLPNDFDKKALSIDYKPNEKIEAPVAKGDKLGTVEYTYGGRSYGSVALVAAEAVQKSAVLGAIAAVGTFFTSTAFKIIVAVLVSLILLFIAYVMVVRNQNKRKRRHRRSSGGKHGK